MYGPQYSAHGSQPFYRPSCSQVIDPAQLPGYPETEVNSELNLGGFSGGSSLQYNNHACHLPVTLGSSTGTSSNLTTHATGPVITGAPADVLGYSQPIQNLRQPWQLHPAQAHTQPTPIPFYPNASSAPDRNKRTSKSRADHSSMAVLLPPEGTSPPLSLPFTHNAETMSHESTALLSAFALDTEASVQNSCVRIAREKKHACWMCHKSFDRPSTLRKHLLVHTGEKAFVCETCGRRFGVASNLNRHVRRCILRPVNTVNAPRATSSSEDSAAPTASPTSATLTSASPSPTAQCFPSQPADTTPATTGQIDLVPTSKCRTKRTRAPSPSPSQSHASANAADFQSQSDSSPTNTQQTFKRRRRAPSPSRWIPFSLLAFDLSPIELQKSTPVPLPPVRPASVRTFWSEERDSWDENVGVAPYDRYEYKGTLPGPGLGLSTIAAGFGGRDVGNLGGGGSYIMGRLVLA